MTRTGTDEKPSWRTSHLTWPHFLFPSLSNTLRIPPVHLTLHLKPLSLTPLQQNGNALKLSRKWIPRVLAPRELLVCSYQGSPCIRESTYLVADLVKPSRLLCNLIVAGSHLRLPFTTMTNPCLTTLPPAPALPPSLLAGCLADVLTEIHAINYELCIPSPVFKLIYT